ncbi:Gti1/Pac2 family-domain-containing protein [Trametes maxima]|nr:Gti1/Pac2 family-domain-containing protein [Trametes maxima]
MFYAPAQDVQRPTHPRLHVRDARDAHIVFEAVRQGLLKPVHRRLNELERSSYIQSGSLFVWEESDDEMGLKRWTDGRVWSQSRMREPYLFYDEKLATDEPSPEPKSKCTYRFVEGPSRTWTSSAQSHYERSDHHPLGLVKQAYSAWVFTAVNARPRKWHLTAYFTYADLPNIPTVDQDPVLRTVTVPPGIYKSGKARSRNSDASTGIPSPPSTPSPAGASRPSSPLHPSPRGKKDGVVLPSLQTAIAHTPIGFGSSHHRAVPRMAEDQRMIQMLNSRPIL